MTAYDGLISDMRLAEERKESLLGSFFFKKKQKLGRKVMNKSLDTKQL